MSADKEIIFAIYITEVTVTDPISKMPVEVEIWKDPVSGGILGIDASFLEQVGDSIVNPLNPETILILDMDKETGE